MHGLYALNVLLGKQRNDSVIYYPSFELCKQVIIGLRIKIVMFYVA